MFELVVMFDSFSTIPTPYSFICMAEHIVTYIHDHRQGYPVQRTCLVASLTILCGPDLIHLSHSFLEFFVLALLVAMSFILTQSQVHSLSVRHNLRRISMACSTSRIGIYSMESGDARSCLCMPAVVSHLTSAAARQILS